MYLYQFVSSWGGVGVAASGHGDDVHGFGLGTVSAWQCAAEMIHGVFQVLSDPHVMKPSFKLSGLKPEHATSHKNRRVSTGTRNAAGFAGQLVPPIHS